jgi:hypothetical protein
MADKTYELTNREIVRLAEGLRGLDGVVESAGKLRRFDFDDNLTWDIAKNSDIVERAAKLYERARKKLAAGLEVVEGQGVTPQNAAAVAAFIAGNEELLDKTQTLAGLTRLNRKTLQSGNKIPPSIFAALMPILEDA